MKFLPLLLLRNDLKPLLECILVTRMCLTKFAASFSFHFPFSLHTVKLFQNSNQKISLPTYFIFMSGLMCKCTLELAENKYM